MEVGQKGMKNEEKDIDDVRYDLVDPRWLWEKVRKACDEGMSDGH